MGIIPSPNYMRAMYVGQLGSMRIKPQQYANINKAPGSLTACIISLTRAF